VAGDYGYSIVSKPMETFVINLDRSPERLEEFRRANPHLKNLSRFPGVDGKTVTHAELLQRGLFAEPILYNEGAIGNALSHIGIWEKAAKKSDITTVFEDDAIVHRDFEALVPTLIEEELPDDWDIAYWGWNFDAVMGFDLFPGTPCAVRFSQNDLRQHWQEIQKNAVRPNMHRLHYAFGVAGYSVSPKGAKKLLKLITPIKPFLCTIPALDLEVQNDAIDSALAGVCDQLNAYACFPPLVLTKNEHVHSTVMQSEPEKAERSLLLTPSDFTESRKYKGKFARYLFAKGDFGGGMRWYLKYLAAGRK
jgi:GR25 family glycosyltransferase involved in LPS biosynthesis